MIRQVVVVGHPEALGVELLGASDIFNMVNVWLAQRGREPAYRLHIASLDGGPLRLWGGIELSSTRSLARHRSPIDTLVVVGGTAAPEASRDPRFARAVAQAAGRSRRVVSLCTGAFFLAAAGLLDGRRATTHWLYGEQLAEQHPDVKVDTDPIFICEGDTWTSAGVTAGFDLLLALVEEDVGSEAARFVARALVLFLRRTGHQAQFSTQLEHQVSGRRPLRDLQQFIADHPDADLSLEALARRVHMSPRHFARLFRAETGLSPGRYVERVRIETARRRLEEGDLPVETVAAECGFGSPETLRRVFVHTLGVSPAEYRRRFGPRRRTGDLQVVV